MDAFLNTLQRFVIGPWTTDPGGYGWIAVMSFLVCATCGIVGVQLLVRRLAMMGDAISHSVLPGIVTAYLLSGSLGPWFMFAGALGAGIATSFFVQVLRAYSPLKQDAAIGVTFSTLFATGVVLVALFADRIHLDTDAVLFGELLFLPLMESIPLPGGVAVPVPVARMAVVATLTAVVLLVFRRQLLIAAFDEMLARTVGVRTAWVHHGLMALTALVVVGSFEAVGAISVVAMLVFPGATALLLSDRLARIHALVIAHALASTVLGIHLAWVADASLAASLVLASALLFGVAWARHWFVRRAAGRAAAPA